MQNDVFFTLFYVFEFILNNTVLQIVNILYNLHCYKYLLSIFILILYESNYTILLIYEQYLLCIIYLSMVMGVDCI